MVFNALATITMTMLVMSNVYSTCRTLLRDGGTETVLRIELQFWVIYVIVHAVTGCFRDDKPELQLIASLFLVLCKHFDSDRSILNSIFSASDQTLKVLDEQFISPNTQRLLVKPCTQLLHYTLSNMKNSTTISKEDKQLAAESIQSDIGMIRAELLSRCKSRLRGGSSNEEQRPETQKIPALRTPEKIQPKSQRVEAAEISFGALRKYFASNSIPMSDEQIPKILALYKGRDEELRAKLLSKFGFEMESSPRSLSTPQSAGVFEGSRSFSHATSAGPATDTVPRRRNPVLAD